MAQELSIRLVSNGSVPLYRQIYDYIREEIRSGSLGANERLPSTRALASGLHVARSTVELAYEQLLSEGYIRSKKNSGYFVSDIENLIDLHLQTPARGDTAAAHGAAASAHGAAASAHGAAASAGGEAASARGDAMSARGSAASLHGNAMSSYGTKASAHGADAGGRYHDPPAGTAQGPDGIGISLKAEDVIDFSLRHTEMRLFPYSTWKRIMKEAMAGADADVFSLGEAQGDLSLRTTIARYLHFSRGVRCTPEQVVVGAGNDYLFMLLRHILGEGRTVAMENPTYLRAAQIFRSFGYRIRFVRMDASGMDPAAVRRSEAQIVYTMPAHQFPMGCVMPVARRAALLRWAKESPDRYIIEDDYDSEFRYRGKPIPALQSLDSAGRVIYMGTFSKAIAPAIRISYMILPPPLLALYRKNCYFYSSTVSRIDQRILDQFMKNGHFERYVNKMRNVYRARHDELLEQLRPFQGRFRIRGTGTGLHILLEMIPEKDTEETDLKETNSEETDLKETDSEGFHTEEKHSEEKHSEEKHSEEKHSEENHSEEFHSEKTSAGVIRTGLSGVPQNKEETEEGRIRACTNAAEQKMARQALAQGVIVYCLSDFMLPAKTMDAPPSFLLGFGALDLAQIREGIARLAKAWL